MAVRNAWLLQKQNHRALDQLAFRRAIANELLETHKKVSKLYQEQQRRRAVCHTKANFICHNSSASLHTKDYFYNYHTH
nr:unnamed protein product [Callosobruchus chinensis]